MGKHDRLLIKAMCTLAEFIHDSRVLWKFGHGLTSEQCSWFV